MVDYLVVGLGLAGIALCETLENNGKSFMVVNDAASGASAVAGGIYNPVVLKRLKLAWKAPEQLPLVAPFYTALERRLNTRFHFPVAVYRRFASVEEQNNWFEAADAEGLQPFLSSGLVPNGNPGLHAPLGFGEVLHTGRIDTWALIQAYKAHLRSKGILVEARFEYPLLELNKDGVAYSGIHAGKIVFATGTGLTSNPYFNYLPLQGNKGEYLHIRCPGLGQEQVIKAAIFLIPTGNDGYVAGATYDYKDQSTAPTPGARAYLVGKLDELVKYPYKIEDQVAGIRPTVIDRRPLIGRHPAIGNMFVLNGFGSRGVMIAPYAAAQLFRAMEHLEPPEPSMDIARFSRKYFSGAPL